MTTITKDRNRIVVLIIGTFNTYWVARVEVMWVRCTQCCHKQITVYCVRAEREIHLVHFNGEDAVFVLEWNHFVCQTTRHIHIWRERSVVLRWYYCCNILVYSGSMERFVAFQGNFGAEYARFWSDLVRALWHFGSSQLGTATSRTQTCEVGGPPRHCSSTGWQNLKDVSSKFCQLAVMELFLWVTEGATMALGRLTNICVLDSSIRTVHKLTVNSCSMHILVFSACTEMHQFLPMFTSRYGTSKWMRNSSKEY